ncbi:MAG: hypothetical protein ABJO57_16240 [Lentilitoribacter sp.]
MRKRVHPTTFPKAAIRDPSLGWAAGTPQVTELLSVLSLRNRADG